MASLLLAAGVERIFSESAHGRLMLTVLSALNLSAA